MQPTTLVPSRASKPQNARLIVVQSFKLALPVNLTFHQRAIRGGFNEVITDVNPDNFPLDELTLGLTRPLPIEVVVALAEVGMRSPLTTEGIIEGIRDTDFLPATTAVHLEASSHFVSPSLGQMAFSLGAIATNWRGQDGQRSALVTRYNSDGGKELSNALLGEHRSWQRHALFFLYRT